MMLRNRYDVATFMKIMSKRGEDLKKGLHRKMSGFSLQTQSKSRPPPQKKRSSPKIEWVFSPNEDGDLIK